MRRDRCRIRIRNKIKASKTSNNRKSQDKAVNNRVKVVISQVNNHLDKVRLGIALPDKAADKVVKEQTWT